MGGEASLEQEREGGSCSAEGRNLKGERRRVSLSKTGKTNGFGQLEE